MEHTKRASSHAFPDEVEVDLDMFGALVLHRISREVDRVTLSQ